MLELPGQRKGTKKYFYKGYFYHLDPRYPNIRDVYICSSRFTQWQCSATAQTSVDGVVTVKEEHCHPPMSLDENQRLEEFKNKLKELGRESVDSPDAIYKFLRQKYSDVAHLILQTSAKMHIIRERKKLQPKLPDNFNDIGEALEKYGPAHEIYRTQLAVSETSSAVIFGSIEMMNRLNDCSEIYVDGTFKCVPKGIGAKQLLILHMRKMNVGMASVFVLCSNQTTELYVTIWNFLLHKVPGLRKNLKCVMMDFERALIKSVKEAMPWVTIRGCWFHFTRAISSHWQSLGLKNVSSTRVQDILSLAWVLPLLPAKNFAEAIEFYRQKADQVEPEYEDDVNEFIDYLENQWLRIAEIVSLWRSPNRTNNVCESFHGRLLKRLGHHPNLFVFIGKLASVISDIESTWRHLEHDGNAVGSKCQKQSHIDLYINYQQMALLNGKLTIPEFLMKIKTKKIKDFIQFKLYSPHYSKAVNPEEILSPQELIDLLGYPQNTEPTINTTTKVLKVIRSKQPVTVQQIKIVQTPRTMRKFEVLSEPVTARQITIHQVPKPCKHSDDIPEPVNTQELGIMQAPKPLQQLEVVPESVNTQELTYRQALETAQKLKVPSEPVTTQELEVIEMPQTTQQLEAITEPVSAQELEVIEMPQTIQQLEAITELVSTQELRDMQVPKPYQYSEDIPEPVSAQELEVIEMPHTTQQLKAITEPVSAQELEVIEMPQTSQVIKMSGLASPRNWEDDLKYSIIIEMELESEAETPDEKLNIIPESIVMPGIPKIKKSPIGKRKKQGRVGRPPKEPSSKPIDKELRSQAPTKRLRKRRAMSPLPGMTIKKVKKSLSQPLKKDESRYKLSPALKRALEKAEKQKQPCCQPPEDNEPRYKFSPSFKTYLRKKEKLKAWLDNRLNNFVNSRR